MLHSGAEALSNRDTVTGGWGWISQVRLSAALVRSWALPAKAELSELLVCREAAPGVHRAQKLDGEQEVGVTWTRSSLGKWEDGAVWFWLWGSVGFWALVLQHWMWHRVTEAAQSLFQPFQHLAFCPGNAVCAHVMFCWWSVLLGRRGHLQQGGFIRAQDAQHAKNENDYNWKEARSLKTNRKKHPPQNFSHLFLCFTCPPPWYYIEEIGNEGLASEWPWFRT